MPQNLDLLSATPSTTGELRMFKEQHPGCYEAKHSGSPMYTHFPALPPSLPSAWDILDFLAMFKNFGMVFLLDIRRLWPAGRVLETEVDVCEPGAETSSREKSQL